jgi:hypothetical protein
MRRKPFRVVIVVVTVMLIAFTAIGTSAQQPEVAKEQPEATSTMSFPAGTATSSEICGGCHVSVYREFAMGFGSDTRYQKIVLISPKEAPLTLPANVSVSSTAHAFAGIDPFPIHARETEMGGASCNVCHYPEAFDIPDIESPDIPKPKGRAKTQELGGMTCASCHITPDGKIRGPYSVKAPHPTVEEPKMRTSAICSHCHSLGKRVAGKQTQTFLEWRDDFHKPELGRQHCQDCHMLRTLRKAADKLDVPIRAVARHLWTGGHSSQRVSSALTTTIVQAEEGKSKVELHVINVAAGHSVPTGSNRRGMYLKADVLDSKGKTVASREWMFAPWYAARPDDKTFLKEDETKPDRISAMQADAQGPHETILRAGEERVLSWTPDLPHGDYTVKAMLTYDLNRYNERAFAEDQTDIYHTSVPIKVK